MDARIEASLNRIKKAYLTEKSKKNISEIKVIDICQKANINKTTFYRHYRDIYDLADTIERETISGIIGQLNYIDEILTDPEMFVKESMSVFDQNSEILTLVFDKRYDALISKVESSLVKHYMQGNHSTYETLLLQFCVGGASHIMTGHLTKEETGNVQEFLINILKKMV